VLPVRRPCRRPSGDRPLRSASNMAPPLYPWIEIEANEDHTRARDRPAPEPSVLGPVSMLVVPHGESIFVFLAEEGHEVAEEGE
ncbi:unnamed protein product, partial [Urochloa humidicola]